MSDEEETPEADEPTESEGGAEESVDEETPETDDETSGADEAEEETEELEAADVETLEERLAATEEDLEAAETEADLDAVEATLDEIADDLEAASLPEPEDEDETDPREELEGKLEDLRSSLEDQRGPYAEDAAEAIEEAATKVTETRWTERGEEEVREAVTSFVDEASATLETEFEVDGEDEAALAATLETVAEAIETADLDPDDDADDVAALVSATDDLTAGLEAAQEWDDLETREQLEAQGFYDVLGHYKDFPPEWSALKEHEKRGNVEMVLLALESFDSDFMEEHCLEALTRMNDQRAFEAMHQRASKRDKDGIRALGKMAAEDAVETLLEYVDSDSDPGLQKVTFKALGEIGSEEATQPLANKLAMENDNVRPYAARALGLIGDARAVDPLEETLADDDSDTVRAAAAWALRQIGTRRALEIAAEYEDDRAYLVQDEARRAVEALEVERPA